MNFEQMSEALQQSIIKAVELCKEKNHPMIDTIHMLKVLFEQDTLDGLFKRLNIDKKLALRMIDEDLRNVVSSSGGEPRFSNEVIQSFEKAKKWSDEHNETYLGCASLWIALMFSKSSISKRLVKTFNL